MIKVEKRIHMIHKEFQEVRKRHPELKMPTVIGKWHYIYKSEKGEVSLIYLPNYFRDGINLWETSYNGDIQRFHSRAEAVKFIKSVL